jgi:hypothetical protein
MENSVPSAPCPALPKPRCVARSANRLRQQLRPEDPRELSSELREDCMPTNFFREDIRVKERRHLVFATDKQLELLSKAKQVLVP